MSDGRYPSTALTTQILGAVGGPLWFRPLFLIMQVKQVYMLTNGYAVMPEGFESILYAGFGYTLKKSDAEALIKNGEALSMEEVDVKSEVKNSSSGRSSISNRGKGLPKGGRKPRGR